jgi:hypothetical protein
MSRAVVYYCGGTTPIIETIISIFSLRKYYDGKIIVLLGKTSLPYVDFSVLDNVEVIEVPGSDNDKTLQQHWASRWRGLGLVEVDKMLHIDCDTVIVKDIEIFFKNINHDNEVLTGFHYVFLNGRSKRDRAMIQSYNKKIPGIKFELPNCYVEIACIGFSKKWPHFNEVSKYCSILKDDQRAVSAALVHNGRKVHIPKFKGKIFKNARAYYRMSLEKYWNTHIWHAKNCFGFFWREFWQAHHQGFMRLNDDAYLRSISDKVYKLSKSDNWSNNIAQEGIITKTGEIIPK